MKKNTFILALIGIVMGMVITSCNDDPTEYPLPEEYNLTTVLSDKFEKQSKRNVFTIDFATDGVTESNGQYSGTGYVLSVQFVGDKSVLPAGSFTPSDEATAKRGSYITGYGTDSGTCFYEVTGGTATPRLVKIGKLAVTKKDDFYTVSGYVWFDNGDAVSVNCSGTIVYEEEKEPVSLTEILAASVTNQGNGTSLISLKLGTAGVTIKPGDYGNTYGGDGNYLAVEFVSTDATIAPGTYTPAESGATTNGNYVMGYDFDYMGMITFENWGTCWFSLEDDVETGTKIRSGDIVVSKSGSNYTITIDNGSIYAQYVGKIEELDGGGGGDVFELTTLFSASYNAPTLTLMIHDGNLSPAYDAASYSWTYSGTGNYIAIELYSPDGTTLAPGTYTGVDSGTAGEGNFVKGYDFDYMGITFENWGTCLFTVKNGTATGMNIVDGTFTVSGSGNSYSIEGSFGNNVHVSYTGPIKMQ